MTVPIFRELSDQDLERYRDQSPPGSARYALDLLIQEYVNLRNHHILETKFLYETIRSLRDETTRLRMQVNRDQAIKDFVGDARL